MNIEEENRITTGSTEVHGKAIDQITGAILSSAIRVHSALGPGLLESAYQACLAHELRSQSFIVQTEVPMPLIYNGVKLDIGYRIDLLVEKQVIVEVKAVESLLPIHTAQLLSYLKLSGNRIGLLMNFHVRSMRDGIQRIANGY